MIINISVNLVSVTKAVDGYIMESAGKFQKFTESQLKEFIESGAKFVTKQQSTKILRANLGEIPWGYAAHHIVAEGEDATKTARDILVKKL